MQVFSWLVTYIFCSCCVRVSRRKSSKKSTRYEQPTPMADQVVSNYDDTQETDPDEDQTHSTGYLFSINSNTIHRPIAGYITLIYLA